MTKALTTLKNNRGEVWKWIAGILLAVLITVTTSHFSYRGLISQQVEASRELIASYVAVGANVERVRNELNDEVEKVEAVRDVIRRDIQEMQEDLEGLIQELSLDVAMLRGQLDASSNPGIER